jgi:hypothetical protein
MNLYDPVGMPRTLRGTPSHIELATVSVVNNDGTVDVQMIGRTAIKSTLQVPVSYKPHRGDIVLTTNISGDQNRPIVLQPISGTGVVSSTQNIFIGHTAPSVPAGTGLYLWFETNVAETEVLEVRLGKA